MKRLWKKRLAAAASLTGIFMLGGSTTVFADQYVFSYRQTVTIPELDAMRGGFVMNGGLQVSMGIIKAVLVDGVLKTVNSLNISNITGGNSTFRDVKSGSLQVSMASETASGHTASQQAGSASTNDVVGSATPIQNGSPVLSSAPATGNPTNPQGSNSPADNIAVAQNSGTQMPVQQGNVQGQQADGSTLVQNIGNLTLVQNSSDQKVIQNITVVNTTVNSISMLRQMNMMSNIKQQFINMLH